jgi:two-component system nitrate/nitrite response regulator NarL
MTRQPDGADPTHVARRPVTVVLADDECMFRSSLRHLLTAPPSVIEEVYGVRVGEGFEVVGEAGSGEETVAVVNQTKPDLLLLDLSMPRMTGLEALSELQPFRDGMRTILLSGSIESAHLLTAIQLSVSGLVMKDSATELLFEAVMAVMSGRFWLGQSLVSDIMELVRRLSLGPATSTAKPSLSLTTREREVVQLVIAGHTNREIATQFSVSEETIKHHLTRMFQKVGASNRLELAMKAAKSGYTASASPAAAAR